MTKTIKRRLSQRWKHRRAPKPQAFSLVGPAHIANEAQTRVEREPQIDYVLVFRERIKQIGDDGLKEEPRLRALEAVVNLYRSHHPNADVDAAKAAVLAASRGPRHEATSA
jgi:hypothetical protein